jgi:hypothetical protein
MVCHPLSPATIALAVSPTFSQPKPILYDTTNLSIAFVMATSTLAATECAAS